MFTIYQIGRPNFTFLSLHYCRYSSRRNSKYEKEDWHWTQKQTLLPRVIFISAITQHFNSFKTGQPTILAGQLLHHRGLTPLQHTGESVTQLKEQAQTEPSRLPRAALGAVRIHTRSKPCLCSPQTHMSISTPSKQRLQPIAPLLPVPVLTRRGAGQLLGLVISHTASHEDILSFKSCGDYCSLPSSASSWLSGDRLACTPDLLEECSRTPPTPTIPRPQGVVLDKKPAPPSHTPELPLHIDISANL